VPSPQIWVLTPPPPYPPLSILLTLFLKMAQSKLVLSLNGGKEERLCGYLAIIISVPIRCQFHQHFFARFFRTNVLFGSFSNYVLALVPKFRTKNVCVNVDEIDFRCQFHQHFLREFYVRKFVQSQNVTRIKTFVQKMCA